MIVLDGHNSHTMYRFCDFAEKHKIILVCLPPHTTHRLQPCDVGVFGPLSSAWKGLVTELSMENIAINKRNFIHYYSQARKKAFTSEMIKSSWKVTGMHPFNPNAIPKVAFAPALNTTTQPVQPMPAALPDLLTLLPTCESTPAPPTSS